MKVVTFALTLCLIGGTLGAEQPIPVIFDIDIGGDIDDTCRISLAQWSVHREIFAGDLDNLDFPKVAAEEFGIHHVEWVSQFFQDKAEDRDYLQQMKDRCEEHGVQSLLIMIDGEAIAMIRLINPMDSRIETFGRNMIPSDHEVKVMWYGKEANQETTITHENLPRRANV